MDQIPLVEALPLTHARVKHRHRIAEASTEARDRLWCERDLGHEHDRIAPRLQLFLDRTEEHFGLARPRNAIKHYHFPAGALLSSTDHFKCSALIRRQDRTFMDALGEGRADLRRAAHTPAFFNSDHTLLFKRFDDR